MSAYYDSYNYPSYWNGRDYEHLSEKFAIESLLSPFKKFRSVIDVGGGYGRLTSTYEKYAQKVMLTDPSKKLISIAQKNIKGKKFYFKVGNLAQIAKTQKNKHDLVIMVRVMHHIKNIDKAINELSQITQKGGYLLLEYANKLHFKSICREIIKGNLNFTNQTESKVVGKSENKNCIPFLNHHPRIISKTLQNYGYKIITERSVSNIRNPTIKKIMPLSLMLVLEKYLQIPFAKIYFGPSIFLLAQKLK